MSQTQQLLELAQCIRSHGVPNFPDPSPTDGILGMIENAASSGVNPQSPAFQAAWKTCKKYGTGANLTPAQSAAQNAKGAGGIAVHALPRGAQLPRSDHRPCR